MEDEVVKLQELFTHQQEQISGMSAEIYHQQKEISLLQSRVKRLTEKLKDISSEESNIRRVGEETPPPHY